MDTTINYFTKDKLRRLFNALIILVISMHSKIYVFLEYHIAVCL